MCRLQVSRLDLTHCSRPKHQRPEPCSHFQAAPPLPAHPGTHLRELRVGACPAGDADAGAALERGVGGGVQACREGESTLGSHATIPCQHMPPNLGTHGEHWTAAQLQWPMRRVPRTKLAVGAVVGLEGVGGHGHLAATGMGGGAGSKSSNRWWPHCAERTGPCRSCVLQAHQRMVRHLGTMHAPLAMPSLPAAGSAPVGAVSEDGWTVHGACMGTQQWSGGSWVWAGRIAGCVRQLLQIGLAAVAVCQAVLPQQARPAAHPSCSHAPMKIWQLVQLETSTSLE